MSPQAQRRSIAKACGWTPLEHGKDHVDNDVWFNPKGGRIWKGNDLGAIHRGLPDYLSSLDAMHEAEKVLTVRYWDRYTQWLSTTAGGTRRFVVVHATAAQRAEAFLRTLNLWVAA